MIASFILSGMQPLSDSEQDRTATAQAQAKLLLKLLSP
jgi:hypothetical protein